MKFKYANDIFTVELITLIKALLGLKSTAPFRSTHLGYDFHSFSEYWQEIGKRHVLIDAIQKTKTNQSPALGFQVEEVLLRFTRTILGNAPAVILYNIRPEGVGKLMDRFPGLSRSLFLVDDVILLQGKDKDSVRRVVLGIPESMADAIGVNFGEAFITNQERPEI